jgi:hypothetical protein
MDSAITYKGCSEYISPSSSIIMLILFEPITALSSGAGHIIYISPVYRENLADLPPAFSINTTQLPASQHGAVKNQ